MPLQIAAAFASGLVFALGLGIGGMTDPGRVVGFLDIAGDWDPGLALVMAGALLTTWLGYRSVTPLLRAMDLRNGSAAGRLTDARLLLGAAIFGIGWGATGYCPGPALVSLSTMTVPVGTFTIAMIIGLLTGKAISGRVARDE